MAAASFTVATSSQTAVRTPAPFVRLLHLWHLYSLDAPTVAGVFLLLFARALQVPHAGAAALALASAVWLIYAGDRLLDGIGSLCDLAPLHVLYRQHAGRFLVMAAGCAGLCAVALFSLPVRLLGGWGAMLAPLAAYAVAVHRWQLPSRWKPLCIATFFAAAMLMPAFTLAEIRGRELYGFIAAGLIFGEVCRRNCTLLQNHAASLGTTLLLGLGCVALGVAVPQTAPMTAACCAAIVLLLLLGRERARFSALTFRALADAALVVPALVLLAF